MASATLTKDSTALRCALVTRPVLHGYQGSGRKRAVHFRLTVDQQVAVGHHFVVLLHAGEDLNERIAAPADLHRLASVVPILMLDIHHGFRTGLDHCRTRHGQHFRRIERDLGIAIKSME